MTFESAYAQAGFSAAYDDALLEARIQAAWRFFVMLELA
jgi:hypothetical protein